MILMLHITRGALTLSCVLVRPMLTSLVTSLVTLLASLAQSPVPSLLLAPLLPLDSLPGSLLLNLQVSLPTSPLGGPQASLRVSPLRPPVSRPADHHSCPPNSLLASLLACLHLHLESLLPFPQLSLRVDPRVRLLF